MTLEPFGSLVSMSGWSQQVGSLLLMRPRGSAPGSPRKRETRKGTQPGAGPCVDKVEPSARLGRGA